MIHLLKLAHQVILPQSATRPCQFHLTLPSLFSRQKSLTLPSTGTITPITCTAVLIVPSERSFPHYFPHGRSMDKFFTDVAFTEENLLKL